MVALTRSRQEDIAREEQEVFFEKNKNRLREEQEPSSRRTRTVFEKNKNRLREEHNAQKKPEHLPKTVCRTVVSSRTELPGHHHRRERFWSKTSAMGTELPGHHHGPERFWSKTSAMGNGSGRRPRPWGTVLVEDLGHGTKLPDHHHGPERFWSKTSAMGTKLPDHHHQRERFWSKTSAMGNGSGRRPRPWDQAARPSPRARTVLVEDLGHGTKLPDHHHGPERFWSKTSAMGTKLPGHLSTNGLLKFSNAHAAPREA
jgi:hypothetical protein